jgi:hypothetical protein
MPNDRSTPEKFFSYRIGIFGSQIECYRIGDEFFLYGVTKHGDARVLPSIGMASEVAASALL